MRYGNSQHLRGFTLIEVVIVLTILAIVSGIAVPRLTNAQARYRADGAAARIMADLAFAQRQARFASERRRIDFDLTLSKYTLVRVSAEESDTILEVVKLAEEPYLATIVSAAFDGDATIRFDGYGMPDSGGSVIVQVGTSQRTVSIAADSGKGSLY